MNVDERLEYMKGVVIGKMKLHPNSQSFVRFNTEQLMALIDIAIVTSQIPKEHKSVRVINALKRLENT